MQLRICISAHCRQGCHRGYAAPLDSTKKKVFWNTMGADVKAFTQGCLIWPFSAGGSKVPCPLGQQMHAERVSELPLFDYLKIEKSENGQQYILILKDDFSGFVFFRACTNTDGETTANTFLEYFTTFVPVLQWFSDQGPHFVIKFKENLSAMPGRKHKFSTSYTLWSNSTADSVCKEALRVMHAFDAEARIPKAEWPCSVPAIQSIIKDFDSRRLGGRAPGSFHTEMEAANPLRLALRMTNVKNIGTPDEVWVLQRLNISSLHERL